MAIYNQLNKAQVFFKDFQVDVVTVGTSLTEDCPVGFGLKSPAPMCSLSMCEWRGGEAVGASFYTPIPEVLHLIVSWKSWKAFQILSFSVVSAHGTPWTLYLDGFCSPIPECAMIT